MLDTVKNERVNGLDLKALGEVVDAIQKDPSQAKVAFNVTTRWAGQTRTETVVDGYTIGGQRVTRTHKVVADEPFELLGGDSAPNPQELLMAALNACITVGYVAGASLQGITLERIEIRTRGELDLRGFLGLSDTVPAGYEQIEYEVRIKGDGTPEQFEAIHQTVLKTSPNYFNVSRPVSVKATLSVE
ncbi:OsmC family protein [Sphingomonas agri]|uniref:OsmC family protein n=1 Tax=Sphingomonas agri TaxID=1813878 RepID=UPI00311D624E